MSAPGPESAQHDASSLFVFTFGGGYMSQQAVVLARDERHALELLREAMTAERLSFPTVVDFTEKALVRDQESGEVDVRRVYGPVALTYGVDG